MSKSTLLPVVVIPNLNGGEALLAALKSLHEQTIPLRIIVVDNASTDGSAHKAQEKYKDVEFIWHTKNAGYAGGVNPGFARAVELDAPYAAPFNDDAIADKHWLERLVKFLDENPTYGSACCKVLKSDGTYLDSTGEFITNWGLPYPRGRNEPDTGQYDDMTDIFAASGAASLYRVSMLREVGLLDESFFAYYEDVDLGFRIQNAGWKVGYVPSSRVYHAVGMTSGRMKGFTTYQTLKNLPLLLWKNLPPSLMPGIMPRFGLAYFLFFVRAIRRGHGWYALKGVSMSFVLLLWKSRKLLLPRPRRKVSAQYIRSMLTYDLPPNAHALRALRARWWKLRGKS